MLQSCRKTDFGFVAITEEDQAIVRLTFSRIAVTAETGQGSPLLDEAFRQLEEYFRRERRKFNLPLAPHGTDFMRKVWNCLLEIPYGKTASYKEIAEAVGISGGMRAVGLANNRNPIPVFIPCHRVIGSNGKLIGYAGGLDLKRRLLDLETGKRFFSVTDG